MNPEGNGLLPDGSAGRLMTAPHPTMANDRFDEVLERIANNKMQFKSGSHTGRRLDALQDILAAVEKNGVWVVYFSGPCRHKCWTRCGGQTGTTPT